MNPHLIFDIGFHHGLDTEFYLRKGFSVVAFEANPQLCAAGRVKFQDFIAQGKLQLVNVGVGHTDGAAQFYVNLDNDEWSSFDKSLGTRDGTRFEVVDVQMLSATRLFEIYGLPYFAKIDIEGYDNLVVEALARLDSRPMFLSVEDSGIDTLIALYNSGARRFQFMDQIDKWKIKSPNPPLEGVYIETTFGQFTSGPFGKELPGQWLGIYEAMKFYVDTVRPNGRLPSDHWWDIHVDYGG